MCVRWREERERERERENRMIFNRVRNVNKKKIENLCHKLSCFSFRKRVNTQEVSHKPFQQNTSTFLAIKFMTDLKDACHIQMLCEFA